ncbi:hypothetical protein Q9R32_00950 [Actinotalea sp. AC32]|nr:hypothetical protein [Actinotalea sp. AC32]
MHSTNTLLRSLHDLGAAAWFGGNLMGAIGLNGASESVSDPSDRLRTASVGWAKWAPVNMAAIGAHLVGGAGLLLANKGRLAGQEGVASSTVAKAALTVAALGTTAYNGVLGAKIAQAGRAPADSAVTPSTGTPDDVAAAQRQQKVLQWVTPALVGAVVVLGAQQGELQRPEQVKKGILGRFLPG